MESDVCLPHPQAPLSLVFGTAQTLQFLVTACGSVAVQAESQGKGGNKAPLTCRIVRLLI